MKTEVFIKRGFVPERLRSIISASGYGLAVLAKKSNLNLYSVNRWVHGEMPPRFDSLSRIAKTLNINPAELYRAVSIAMPKTEFRNYRAALSRRVRECPKEGDEERLGYYA